MRQGLKIAFFGSSLVSAYWNGAATYFRGIIKNLSGLGHEIAFYEPDAYDRQKHRDIDDPDWAKVEVYPATESGVDEALVHEYDFIFTYGGGSQVVDEYKGFGARECRPIYNALDPETHYPVTPVERFRADLGFLGNRMPDREARVSEFFFKAAGRKPRKKFLLGGSGWGDLRLSHVERLPP